MAILLAFPCGEQPEALATRFRTIQANFTHLIEYLFIQEYNLIDYPSQQPINNTSSNTMNTGTISMNPHQQQVPVLQSLSTTMTPNVTILKTIKTEFAISDQLSSKAILDLLLTIYFEFREHAPRHLPRKIFCFHQDVDSIHVQQGILLRKLDYQVALVPTQHSSPSSIISGSISNNNNIYNQDQQQNVMNLNTNTRLVPDSSKSEPITGPISSKSALLIPNPLQNLLLRLSPANNSNPISPLFSFPPIQDFELGTSNSSRLSSASSSKISSSVYLNSQPHPTSITSAPIHTTISTSFSSLTQQTQKQQLKYLKSINKKNNNHTSLVNFKSTSKSSLTTTESNMNPNDYNIHQNQAPDNNNDSFQFPQHDRQQQHTNTIIPIINNPRFVRRSTEQQQLLQQQDDALTLSLNNISLSKNNIFIPMSANVNFHPSISSATSDASTNILSHHLHQRVLSAEAVTLQQQISSVEHSSDILFSSTQQQQQQQPYQQHPMTSLKIEDLQSAKRAKQTALNITKNLSKIYFSDFPDYAEEDLEELLTFTPETKLAVEQGKTLAANEQHLRHTGGSPSSGFSTPNMDSVGGMHTASSTTGEYTQQNQQQRQNGVNNISSRSNYTGQLHGGSTTKLNSQNNQKSVKPKKKIKPKFQEYSEKDGTRKEKQKTAYSAMTGKFKVNNTSSNQQETQSND